MLGTVAMFDFDWPEAERQFQLAMSHGAIAPRVRRYYAHYCLLPTGRAQEAGEQYRLGSSEDPLNLQFRIELAVCLRAAGRLAESDEELRAIMQIDETFWFPHFVLGVNRALDGMSRRRSPSRSGRSSWRPGSGPSSGCERRCCDAVGKSRRRTRCAPSIFGPAIATPIRSVARCFTSSAASWMPPPIGLKQRSGSAGRRPVLPECARDHIAFDAALASAGQDDEPQ